MSFDIDTQAIKLGENLLALEQALSISFLKVPLPVTDSNRAADRR